MWFSQWPEEDPFGLCGRCRKHTAHLPEDHLTEKLKRKNCQSTGGISFPPAFPTADTGQVHVMTQNIPFFPGELQQGESKYWQRGNLVVTTWRDRKLVYIMSTNTSPTATTTVKRRTKDGHVENVTCPLSIQLYNSYMGGVDRADQLRGYYCVWMKSHKFYRFVFLNLLVFTLSISSFPLSSTDTSSGFSWTVAL